MNKIEKQLQFFETIKEYLKRNPYLNQQDIRSLVYSTLIKAGTNEEEQDLDLLPLFTTWNNYFSNTKNITAFYDPCFQDFFQLKNKREKISTKTAIKLYIPMDSYHIEKGVAELFQYLSRADIPHISKIRREVTLDNVVIRVDSLEDANKIIDFVSKNDYIKEGLISPNPFLVDRNNIALTMDGNTTSYNGILSDMISDYMYKKVKFKDFDTISFAEFQNNLKRMNEENKLYLRNPNSENDNVLKLILKNLGQEAKYFDFEHYVAIRKYQEKQGFVENEDILEEVIKTLIQKYGIINAKARMRKYLETEDINLFTRDNNIREKVSLYLNPQAIKESIKRKMPQATSIDEYIDSSLFLELDEERIKILESSCISTYKKYGLPQLKGALKSLILNGNYQPFTNDNQSRYQLINNISQEDATTILGKYVKSSDKEELINLYSEEIERKVKETNSSKHSI